MLLYRSSTHTFPVSIGVCVCVSVFMSLDASLSATVECPEVFKLLHMNALQQVGNRLVRLPSAARAFIKRKINSMQNSATGRPHPLCNGLNVFARSRTAINQQKKYLVLVQQK